MGAASASGTATVHPVWGFAPVAVALGPDPAGSAPAAGANPQTGCKPAPNPTDSAPATGANPRTGCRPAPEAGRFRPPRARCRRPPAQRAEAAHTTGGAGHWRPDPHTPSPLAPLADTRGHHTPDRDEPRCPVDDLFSAVHVEPTPAASGTTPRRIPPIDPGTGRLDARHTAGARRGTVQLSGGGTGHTAIGGCAGCPSRSCALSRRWMCRGSAKLSGGAGTGGETRGSSAGWPGASPWPVPWPVPWPPSRPRAARSRPASRPRTPSRNDCAARIGADSLMAAVRSPLATFEAWAAEQERTLDDERQRRSARRGTAFAALVLGAVGAVARRAAAVANAHL